MTPPDDVSTRLAEIRERVEAATEGPWRRSIWNHATGDETPCITAEGLTLFRTHESPARVFEKHDYEAGAEFVAAARSDVPYLLSLVEEVCELLDGWERAYPTDTFPEPPERPDEARLVWVDPDTGEKLSETFALGRVSAAMGRFMAAALRRALRDAAQEGEG